MTSKIRARPMQKSSFVARIASGLSFIAALIISGILSFFINALRQGYRPVPWPIVIVMVASCFNIVSFIFTAFIRYLTPSSLLFLGSTDLLAGINWLVSTILLGRELNGHLGTRCPQSSDLGHDFSLVCHLYKALFAFSITATFFSLLVALFDIRNWRQSKTTKYRPMERNEGGMADLRENKRTGKRVSFIRGILKKRNNNTQNGERGIMLKSMHSEDIHTSDGMRLTNTEGNLEPVRTYPLLSDVGPRQRGHMDDRVSQFEGQDTRYDPGSRML